MAKKPLGVLILHGFSSSLDSVKKLEAPIQALGLPTRMPALRGHCAESPDALRGVVWQDWLADAEAAMQDLLTEAERVIIFGFSMGGLLALTLAAGNKSVVDSLILMSAAIRLVSPLAPGRPFHFLIPLVRIMVKKWDLPPVYSDMSFAKFDTNYRWTPMDALLSFVELTEVIRTRLADIHVPALIIQSRKDTTAAPESAEIIMNGIATPPLEKRIAWFDVSEHEMLQDCEQEAVLQTILRYVQERAGLLHAIKENVE
jgi:carboxylesterase